MAGDEVTSRTEEETNQSTVMIDHNHPLYLHPPDTLGALSLGFQLQGMENYTIWSQAMEVSLLTWNKLGFIDGSVARDTYGDTHANLWDCSNAIVKSWIMHNVSRDLLSRVLFRSSAYAIWSDLKERFDKDLWDEYDSIMPPHICCDKSKKFIERQEYQRLWQFLTELNDGYSQARSQIIMKSKIQTVNQAYAMILQDESQKLVVGGGYSAESIDPTALFSSKLGQKQRRNFNVECDFCHLKGHTKEECYKLIKCDYCNKKGHLRANYYKLIGYPADFKPQKRANMVESSNNQPIPSSSVMMTQDQHLGPMQGFTSKQHNHQVQ
ncbi:uncharacterized protein LOC142182332 [Nicotiana tabacum]|uniref:Uncharacterized protein LOC142182332 n=1 Tax=Nicotiana tabacum TaxID=4097 RepID=A0AC58UT57_TOBAC